ncbi:MAG TPA: hypothetical protein VMH05_25610 [Bryobacteraceae bacterium]|nr:hypothetical protein [Bryobacteraceae bacterium]
MIPLGAFAWLFTAILPLFFFALYRNEGTLHFSKFIRLCSLVTALVFGFLVVLDLWEWSGSLSSYWAAMKLVDWKGGATSVFAAARNPRTIGETASVLGQVGNFAYILLLLALWHQPDGEPSADVGAPVSRLLRRVTKVALIAYGIWVAFNLVRVIVTPYFYFQIRTTALRIGRQPPQLTRMMASALRMLLDQACLFMAPYIVYNSWLRPDGSTVEGESEAPAKV